MIFSQILATGAGVPERVVPNDFFNYLVDDADNWIFSRTGMRERRFAAPDESTSDLATIAARKTLESANIDPAELDCIILGTSTADMILPSAACMVLVPMVGDVSDGPPKPHCAADTITAGSIWIDIARAGPQIPPLLQART